MVHYCGWNRIGRALVRLRKLLQLPFGGDIAVATGTIANISLWNKTHSRTFAVLIQRDIQLLCFSFFSPVSLGLFIPIFYQEPHFTDLTFWVWSWIWSLWALVSKKIIYDCSERLQWARTAWHDEYKVPAYIFVDLTEGNAIIFSQ